MIAFDAFTGAGVNTTSFTHTPVGTPRGIILFVADGNDTAPSGVSATYGGVAMTPIASATDSAGETGWVKGFFLGSGIPTGAQTVAISGVGNTGAMSSFCYSVTGNNDTQLAGIGSAVVQGDATDPSVSITSIVGSNSMGFSGVFSGQNNVGSITAGSGYTQRGANDIGNFVLSSENLDTPSSSATLTINWTIAAEDCAMVGIAIQESPLQGGAFLLSMI